MSQAKRVHVLQIIDKLSMDGVNPSSVALLLKEWIPRFYGHAIDTSICCLHHPDRGGEWLQEHGIPVSYIQEGKYSWKNVRGICRLSEHVHADVLHLHGYRAANFGRVSARQLGVINIVHEHAVLPILPHQWIADALLRNYTDVAVAVSETVREFMIWGRRVPARKIRVIGNGINVADYARRSSGVIGQKKRELGIPSETRIIGAVTRLRKEKGVEYLIHAIPEIVKACPHILVLVVGDGPQKAELEQLAKRYHIDGHLKFLGFRADVKELLSLFDVNVIPSLSEGYCLALVEAMAAGNPIVASAVGGMREIAKDGESALFVPPKDSNEISQKVTYLLKNPDSAFRLSQAARKKAQDYDIKVSAKALSALYWELARPVGKAGPC